MHTNTALSYRERVRLYIFHEAPPIGDQQQWAKLIYCEKLPEEFFRYLYEQLTSNHISPLDAMKELERFNETGAGSMNRPI